MNLMLKNWFLIGLLVALASGFHWAPALAELASLDWLKWTIVTITMFLMAWPLEFGHLQNTIARPQASLLASGLNMIAIPLLVWPLMLWIGGDLGAGMMIAAATPSTLASSAVWTRRAGGDDSVAIMVTLITNSTCFLVMPFWIYVQTGSSVDSGMLTDTIHKLFFFVVLPIAVAQLVRMNRTSAAWASAQKPLLSILAMVGILAMVFVGAISMGLRFGEQERVISWQSLTIVGLLLTAVHCLVFWGGIGLARALNMSRQQQIAVGFSSSQKTLMIGLTVAISLEMSIIPIVMYHAMQLVVDTYFADRIRSQD